MASGTNATGAIYKQTVIYSWCCNGVGVFPFDGCFLMSSS